MRHLHGQANSRCLDLVVPKSDLLFGDIVLFMSLATLSYGFYPESINQTDRQLVGRVHPTSVGMKTIPCVCLQPFSSEQEPNVYTCSAAVSACVRGAEWPRPFPALDAPHVQLFGRLVLHHRCG